MALLTHIILVITIVLFLLFAIYDQFILACRYGETLLLVKLRNRSRFDDLIFIGLVAVLFYQYGINPNDPLTGYLLGTLLVITIYVYLIRKPKLILKKDGFFFSCLYIPYRRIKNIKLTENGILVIQLEVKQISIYARTLDDLESICKTLVETSYGEQVSIQNSCNTELPKSEERN